MPKRVAIDFHNTMVDLHSVTTQMAEELYGYKIRLEDLTEWRWSDCTPITDEQFWNIIDICNNTKVNTRLAPIGESNQAVFTLSCYYPVEVCTASREIALKDIRLWLNSRGLKDIPLTCTDGVAGAADAKLSMPYDIYVDDNPRFVGKMPSDKYLILFDRPWNQNVTPNKVNEFRAKSWDDVIAFIHTIQGTL